MLRSQPAHHTAPATSPSAPPYSRGYRVLAGILILTALLRLPSLFDPPWVNDEGTYFAIAQAMAHGYRLYTGVWENKPPGLYLLYLAVYHSLGPSLIAVRLLAGLAVLLLVVLTRLLVAQSHADCAAGAATLAGVLMAVPFLEGTTANAEVFISVATAAAVYLTVGRNQPMLGALAMLLAISFKAVAGFDLLALGIWLLLQRREVARAYLITVLAGAMMLLGVAAATGIAGGMIRDAVLYDLGYVGHANGNAVPWVLLVKLLVLGGLTFWLRRSPFPYLWLVYAAAGALISGRFFGHYALQAVCPLAISLALAWPRVLAARRAPAILTALYVTLALLTAAVGWALAATGHDSILARRLQYYPNFIRVAAGTESRAVYRAQVDDQVNRNLAIAALLHNCQSGKLLVWGNTPWVYVLSNRLPATPYTSARRWPEVPGETHTLQSALSHGLAATVVVISPPDPALGAAQSALESDYRLVGRVANATVYARRGAACTRSPASVAASASNGTR